MKPRRKVNEIELEELVNALYSGIITFAEYMRMGRFLVAGLILEAK